MHPSILPVFLACLMSASLAVPTDNLAEVSGDPENPTPKDMAITDIYLFNTPLHRFIAHRNDTNPPTLVWESDGCTYVPRGILPKYTRSFQIACYRHDFGYRNYKRQERASANAKIRIDNLFLRE